jgi:hypothetical protein
VSEANGAANKRPRERRNSFREAVEKGNNGAAANEEDNDNDSGDDFDSEGGPRGKVSRHMQIRR